MAMEATVEERVKCPQCSRTFPASLIKGYVAVMPKPNPQDARTLQSCPVCVVRLRQSKIGFNEMPTQADIEAAEAELQRQRDKRHRRHATMLDNLQKTHEQDDQEG